MRALADVDQLGVLADARERRAADETVVEDHVGARDQLKPADRHQAGIAGARSDQVDDPGAGAAHAGSRRERSRISDAPAASIRSASSLPRPAGSAPSPSSESRTHSLPSGSPANPW